jgi:nucleotide-binding universal stress UspA family protein
MARYGPNAILRRGGGRDRALAPDDHTTKEANLPTIARIAAGVNGQPAGLDAVVLGETIAAATGAELMLVAVHSDPLVVLPSGMNWKALEKQAEQTVRDARDKLAPGARVDVETDVSVARALGRVVQREHRDLLVLGSSRRADQGTVRIGKRARQLLHEVECALAIAPSGMSRDGERRIERIGVGYDGGPESQAALAHAGSIAAAAGAKLHVRGVVDDRLPALGWSAIGGDPVIPQWDELVESEEQTLLAELTDAARASGASVETEVRRGRPADALLELSDEVDLLVIGSRRWGPVARLILGSTGEALLFHARCPVMVFPRPRD